MEQFCPQKVGMQLVLVIQLSKLNNRHKLVDWLRLGPVGLIQLLPIYLTRQTASGLTPSQGDPVKISSQNRGNKPDKTITRKMKRKVKHSLVMKVEWNIGQNCREWSRRLSLESILICMRQSKCNKLQSQCFTELTGSQYPVSQTCERKSASATVNCVWSRKEKLQDTICRIFENNSKTFASNSN